MHPGWMPIKLCHDKDSSSLFIDSDGKKILTDTFYNTIGYRNMGFSPEGTCYMLSDNPEYLFI